MSEALRLSCDLVSGWTGRRADLPHRFLQLTTENHWVPTSSDARVWYETVLALCDHHVLGAGPVSDVLPG